MNSNDGGSSEERIPFLMVTLPNNTMSVKLNRLLESDDIELEHTFSETLGLLKGTVPCQVDTLNNKN